MTEKQAEQTQQWFQDNINMKELDKKIEATLEYVKRFNSPDDNGEWNVWAYEFVDGHHGVYTIRLFLDEILNGGSNNHDTGSKWLDSKDQDEILSTFDGVSTQLADLFNANTSLPGTFWIGHNENDGSLGVTYSIKA